MNYFIIGLGIAALLKEAKNWKKNRTDGMITLAVLYAVSLLAAWRNAVNLPLPSPPYWIHLWLEPVSKAVSHMLMGE